MASRGRMAQLLADIEREYDLLLEENAELRARLAKYEKVKDPITSPRGKRRQGEKEQGSKRVERTKASTLEGTLTPQARGSFQKRDVWTSTRVLEGHRDGVWEVTPCPWSLGRVGTASADRTARVWSLAHNSSTYAHVQYVGHIGSVNSIRFHPKERLVCTAAGDASVHVWKLPTSMKKFKDASIAGHSKRDSCEQQATLWSPLLGSPSLPTPLDESDPEPTSSPVDIAVSKRLKEKAATMGELQLGSPTRGELLPDMGVVLDWHEPRIESEEFVINIDTPLLALSGHSGPVVAADWLHGGSCLATVSWDDTVRLWDAEGGAKISEALQGVEDGHYSTNLTTKADSPCVAVSSTDGFVRVWDLRANNQGPANQVLAHEGTVSSALLAATCDFGLFTAGDDRAFRTWDLRNTKQPVHTSRCSSGINRFSASPVTGTIALPLDDRRTKICDISGNRLGNIRSHDKLGHTAMITCTAWSNDESVVYTSSFSRTRSLIAWTKADRKQEKRKNRDTGL